jgi:hypothetical protein
MDKETNSKIRELIKYLRDCSKIEGIKDIEIAIPDDCEKYGFSEGNYKLGIMLHFFADMIE